MTLPTVFDRNPTLAKPGGRAAWAESLKPLLASLRSRLQERDPAEISLLSGAQWQESESEFRLYLLDEVYRIPWPECVAYGLDGAEPCPADRQGLFLYYLDMADVAAPADRWISYRELPNGWLYHQAFQGYSGNVLVRELGNDIVRLASAARAVGGREFELGDYACEFQALPRIKLALVYWLGDEEFTSQAQVFFDAAASHYLTTDALAGLGSHLVQHLLRRAA